jgi:hypothetical protein
MSGSGSAETRSILTGCAQPIGIASRTCGYLIGIGAKCRRLRDDANAIVDSGCAEVRDFSVESGDDESLFATRWRSLIRSGRSRARASGTSERIRCVEAKRGVVEWHREQLGVDPRDERFEIGPIRAGRERLV